MKYRKALAEIKIFEDQLFMTGSVPDCSEYAVIQALPDDPNSQYKCLKVEWPQPVAGTSVYQRWFCELVSPGESPRNVFGSKIYCSFLT